jgi:lysophospholipase L1-like esterase
MKSKPFSFARSPMLRGIVGILVIALPFVSAAQTKIKLGCAGTSITYGTGTGQGYFVFLYPLIGTKYEIFNGGAGGSTTGGWLTSYGAPQIFNNTPDIVITEFAANDIRSDTWKGRDTYIANYNKIIDALQAMSSKPRVIIMLGPPVWSPNIHGIMADTMNLIVIPALKALAAQRNLQTVDCYTPLLSHRDLFPGDGVHPTSPASDTMAHVVAWFLLGDTIATGIISEKSPVIKRAESSVSRLMIQKCQLETGTGLSVIRGSKIYSISGKKISSAPAGNLFVSVTSR